MAHRELNHIAIATFFATVTAGADAVPHWLLVGSSDRALRGVWVQCLALLLLLLLLRCAWPAAGKRPKCMLFRLNCRFSQTSPATVCTCGSYITAIYAANGMAHTVATVIRRTRRTYLKLLSSLWNYRSTSVCKMALSASWWIDIIADAQRIVLSGLRLRLRCRWARCRWQSAVVCAACWDNKQK